jgi:hypothetical protein
MYWENMFRGCPGTPCSVQRTPRCAVMPTSAISRPAQDLHRVPGASSKVPDTQSVSATSARVASRTGNSVPILLTIYINRITGDENDMKRRIENELPDE